MQIIPNVYQITSGITNVILIAEAELTLIDTGLSGTARQIIDFIRKISRSPEEISHIFLTHAHFDHAGGLAELKKFTKAKVVLHKADIGAEEKPVKDPEFVSKALQISKSILLKGYVHIKPDDADIVLEGGEKFSPLGGLEVIHTPGHTPGSISLYAPKKKLLIVGDALNHFYRDINTPPKMVSTDVIQAVESVKKLSRLDFDILCFGHGKPVTRNAKDEVLKLLTEIDNSG